MIEWGISRGFVLAAEGDDHLRVWILLRYYLPAWNFVNVHLLAFDQTRAALTFHNTGEFVYYSVRKAS